jgi:hypothetical protein
MTRLTKAPASEPLTAHGLGRIEQSLRGLPSFYMAPVSVGLVHRLIAHIKLCQSENERLKETALTVEQAGWLLQHAHIIGAWPEIGDTLRRISETRL